MVSLRNNFETVFVRRMDVHANFRGNRSTFKMFVHTSKEMPGRATDVALITVLTRVFVYYIGF